MIPAPARAGVAGYPNFGGGEQFTVTFRPAQLDRYGLTLSDVTDAVKSNNTAAGGSVLPRGSMSFVIRGSGALQNIEQIENVFVKSVGGVPIYVKQVATVTLDSPPPPGIYAKDRAGEGVEGICLMRRGENPSRVLGEVQKAVTELNESELPPGSWCPSTKRHLVDTTRHRLLQRPVGITLVVRKLLFLGRPATALLVAVTIRSHSCSHLGSCT